MKKLILLIVILTGCNSNISDKNSLKNSTWKFCGDTGRISDILIFSDAYSYVKNDSIYVHTNNSLIGVIDKIEYYYGERRLLVKDLKGNVVRYSEQ